MKKILIVILFYTFGINLFAQKEWSLEDCISYGIENSFQIKKNLINIESKKISLSMSKMNLTPEIAGYAEQNFSFGAAEGADGIITRSSQTNTSLGLNLRMPLFEGLRNYYQIKSSKLDLKAAILDLDKLKDDIELNIIAFYLQALLCKELKTIAENQLLLSQNQQARISILEREGKCAENELYSIKATVANDQYKATEAKNNYALSLLDLQHLLNISLDNPVTVKKIEDSTQMEMLLDRQFILSNIINNAILNRNSIKVSQARIEKSLIDVKIARAGWFPSISLQANYGSGYYYIFQNYTHEIDNKPFADQMRNNGKEMIALSMSVPIFDKLNTYNNVKLAKLNKQSLEVNLEEDKFNLAKEIEQAYANFLASKERYISADYSAEAAQKAMEYETVKYNAGTSTFYEHNETKNRLEEALSNKAQAKYNFIMKMKILEIYSK